MQEDVYQGDGVDLYAYCGNNPVVYSNPSGYAGTPLSDDGFLPDAQIGESGSNSDDESGRFVSTDGTRVFRMGENDILGWHGGGPHVNVEILEASGMMVGT